MNATSLNSTTLYNLPSAVPIFKLKDGATWELVLLITITTTYICICAIVTVASFRVSRTTFAFALFFSEGVANIGTIAIYALSYVGQLVAPAHFRLSPNSERDGLLARMISYICYIHYGFIFASQLHYLLIAVNRGIALCLPFYYQRWWTLRNTIVSTLILWALSIALGLRVYLSGRGSWGFISTAGRLLPAVTTPCLVIYCSALAWVLLNRYLLPSLIKGSSNASAAEAGAKNPFTARWKGTISRLLHSITPGSSMQSVDLRIFTYCFLAFIPNCYYMVVKPTPNSLHVQLYSTFRPASTGILLYAMSSLVREQVPTWKRLVPRQLAKKLLFIKSTEAGGEAAAAAPISPNKGFFTSSIKTYDGGGGSHRSDGTVAAKDKWPSNNHHQLRPNDSRLQCVVPVVAKAAATNNMPKVAWRVDAKEERTNSGSH